jgi:hypothetical protein
MLWKRRGGIREGHRNNAAMLYAHFLTVNGIAREDVEQRVQQFARDCRPPLSPREVRGALQTGPLLKTGPMSIRNIKIADLLGVTPAESEALVHCGGGPRKCWPPASKYLTQRDTRAKMRRVRRSEILAIINSKGGEIPSSRRIASLLRARRGICASHRTVQNDLRALQLAPIAQHAA